MDVVFQLLLYKTSPQHTFCFFLSEDVKVYPTEWSFYEMLKLKFSGDTAVFTWEEGSRANGEQQKILFQTSVINQHFTKRSKAINLLSKEELL